ncbi:CbrC family protein [Aurantiacibacter zhengii]|uniref:CbrC family protein n=1 Tax=Aurantiacibacter zhengii TaxID=2307003 RepID=UPI001313E8EB|nr:CbrC family protein [Aurantiacibacter zhengii]
MRLFGRKLRRKEEKPHFRFYPGAYAEGGPLVASAKPCDCCGQPCVWEYTGNIYASTDATVCAGCIAAGYLGQIFKDGYSLDDIELETEVGQALSSELFERTPGVACFDPFEWPVADDAPMAFIGYGADFEKDSEAVRATTSAFSKLGWDDQTGPSDYALLFRPLGGGPMRAVIDLD